MSKRVNLSLKVCKKCSHCRVDLGLNRYERSEFKTYSCGYDILAKQHKKTGKITLETNFEIPKDCPYPLEHLISF